MSIEQVISILENTVSGTQTQITEATQILEGAREANFGGLLQTLAVVLSNEGASSVSRRQAALFMKNSVSGNSQAVRDKNTEKWLAIDASVRNTIKGHVLSALVTKDHLVGNQVAQALASIAIIELPRGEWKDLMPSLIRACDTKNSDELRESALKTLGYICKELEESQLVESIGGIFTGVISNMVVPNERVRHAALEALLDMVGLLTPVFKVKAQSDALMNVIFQNCTSANDEMKILGLNVLNELVYEYYPDIDSYMSAIAQLTVTFIGQCKEEEDVIKQAIEIWLTIAEVETVKAYEEKEAASEGIGLDDIKKSRKYIEKNLKVLLDALFVPLAQPDPDAEEDEWNMSHAAATCISYFAECVEEKIIPFVLPLFTANIMKEDWRLRDAATILWGSVLVGPSTDALRPYLSDASLLTLFLQHMKDPVATVRCSTAWTLGRMCELHVGVVVVTDGSRFEAIYKAFKDGLEDEPLVSTMCSWGLMVLTESLDDYIKKSSLKNANPLAAHFTDLVNDLFKCGEKRGCPAKQRKSAYQALCALVRCSTPECIPKVASVTVMCLERLATMTGVADPPDRKDADELESLVCALMSECVKKLDNNIKDISDRVCAMYLTVYKNGHGAAAQEEAVRGLGVFAGAMGPAIEKYAEQIAIVLKGCIEKPEELDVCKTALGSVYDLSSALQEKSAPLVPVFIPALFALLSPKNDRSLFSFVFGALGDLSLNATKEAAQYIPQIINIAQQAMASKVDLDDEDEKDFLFELQESCFECIAGIQGGLTALGASNSILPLSGNITQCITLAYNNMMRPESLSRAIVGAICDLVIAAGPRTKEAMAPGNPWANFVEYVKTIETNAEEPETKNACKYALEQIVLNLRK